MTSKILLLTVTGKFESVRREYYEMKETMAVVRESHQRHLDDCVTKETLKLQDAEEQLRTSEQRRKELEQELSVTAQCLDELKESHFKSEQMVIIAIFPFLISRRRCTQCIVQ